MKSLATAFGALCLAAAIGLPSSAQRVRHEPREHSIDYGGALALSVGVTAVLLASAWAGRATPGTRRR